MRQRLRGRDGREGRGIPIAKRSAAGRHDETAQARTSLPAQTLMDGGVLAVDGQDLGSRGARQFHQELAGHDQGLLVGQGEILAALEDAPRGFHAGRTDDPVNGQVELGLTGHFAQCLRAGAQRHPLGQRLAQRIGRGRIRDRHDRGSKFASLLGERLPGSAGGERPHAQPVGVIAHDVERLGPDRAGAAEEGEGLHGTREHRELRGALRKEDTGTPGRKERANRPRSASLGRYPPFPDGKAHLQRRRRRH